MLRSSSSHYSSGGFTLVEAMVVVAIVGLLIGFSYTGFSGILQRQRCEAAAHKVAWVLKQTQMHAMEKHTRCAVILGTGNETLQTFLDRDEDYDLGDNDTLLEDLNIGQEFRGVDVVSGARFQFSQRGIPRGTFPKIRLRCRNTQGGDGNVTVSSMGRVSIATPDNWRY